MAKRMLSYGSSGEDVKELQKALNNVGFSLDVDGKFGAKTQSAVKSYQKNRGLSVDGIVGNNTWTSLSSSITNNNTTDIKPAISTGENATTEPSVEIKRPEYKKSEAVVSAENNLNNWEQNKPGEFSSKYSDEIESVLKSILSREKFNYNINADPLYNQYREQYVKNGKKAMMDTIANASALTGGYANSYAVSAGNQSYNDYLSNLNDIALDLYTKAYSVYKDKGEMDLERIGILNDLDKADYDKYRDSLEDYYRDGEYLLKKLSDMSESEYERFLDEIKGYENDRDFNYQKYLDELKEKQFYEELDFSKNKFQQELEFKKSEAERDQKNKDRNYYLSASKNSTSSSSSKKNQNDTTETKATILPRTYEQFVYLTGFSGILNENEFNLRKSAKKEYGSYENYIKEMFYKYGDGRNQAK